MIKFVSSILVPSNNNTGTNLVKSNWDKLDSVSWKSSNLMLLKHLSFVTTDDSLFHSQIHNRFTLKESEVILSSQSNWMGLTFKLFATQFPSFISIFVLIRYLKNYIFANKNKHLDRCNLYLFSLLLWFSKYV